MFSNLHKWLDCELPDPNYYSDLITRVSKFL